jgi:hypothetical protein
MKGLCRPPVGMSRKAIPIVSANSSVFMEPIFSLFFTYKSVIIFDTIYKDTTTPNLNLSGENCSPIK